jgi:hypothetical protein
MDREQPKKSLERRVDVIEIQLDKVIVPKLDNVVAFVDKNQGGITLAQLLNSRLTNLFLFGLLMAAIYFLTKGNISLQ